MIKTNQNRTDLKRVGRTKLKWFDGMMEDVSEELGTCCRGRLSCERPGPTLDYTARNDADDESLIVTVTVYGHIKSLKF